MCALFQEMLDTAQITVSHIHIMLMNVQDKEVIFTHPGR